MHDYSCNNYLGLRLQNFEEQMDCMINHNGVDMVLNDALCNDMVLECSHHSKEVTAQYHQYIEQYLYLSAFWTNTYLRDCGSQINTYKRDS